MGTHSPYLFIVALLLATFASEAQNKVQQKLPEKTRILFVLDGSGSMEAVWEGNQSRMEVAKKILTRLVDSLRNSQNLELALRVYGHRFSRQANNCTDSYLEVPFGPKNHNTMLTKLKEIKPRGNTPITYSLQQAANDFPATTGYRNILILITDGIESCGGDPCATSLEFQRKGIFLRPFIIGLGLDGGKALECMGLYIDSQNATTFNQVLNQSIQTTFAKTTVSVELLDGSGRATESNINISFINANTGNSAFEFVHYRDKQGKPDSVQLDPVISYDMIVNSLPTIVLKQVNIINGQHNVITIAVPQGNLVIRNEGRGNPFNTIVRQKGKAEILNQQGSGETYRYLAGDYVVESLTFPRRIFHVTVAPDKLSSVTIPSPGTVNINTIVPGFGSLFEIMDDGSERWVCRLDEQKSFHNYNLLPGRYRIAFRAKDAPGSKYTGVKTFSVTTGKNTMVNVFN
ncbi:MAG: VWA domain-containing protein [Cyclobacteriaceae bacterium]|nr:VWA domain-containing protein [Cyclobacteriaceae bacterium]